MKSCYFYLLLHPSEREVASCQIDLEVGKGFFHESLHSERQFFGDAVDAADNSDPGGMDGGRGVDVPSDLGGAHVNGVDSVGSDALLVLDEWVEHVRENLYIKQIIYSIAGEVPPY